MAEPIILKDFVITHASWIDDGTCAVGMLVKPSGVVANLYTPPPQPLPPQQLSFPFMKDNSDWIQI